MSKLPNCPKCDSEYTYEDGHVYVCPMCHHEWTSHEQDLAEEAAIVRDSNGNEIYDGDEASVIRDIKLSASERIKQGTKIKNIRILEQEYNGHDIECNVEGHGRMYLKSELIKK